GDLSDNYEYKAAKEKQARLMQKAHRLRDEVARARVIAAGEIDTSEVTIGCRVTLADETGQHQVYTLLGPWDTDTDQGVISYQSPFAGRLMGKKVGDSIDVDGHNHTVVAIESAV
ncbi:MAG: GreA/GreB family elongation factor, partial [candidate division WOR-3 bacterium]